MCSLFLALTPWPSKLIPSMVTAVPLSACNHKSHTHDDKRRNNHSLVYLPDMVSYPLGYGRLVDFVVRAAVEYHQGLHEVVDE